MPGTALKRALKCLDFFYEKQDHDKASSVFGGMLTTACVVAAIVYIILAFVLDEPAFIESTTLVKTRGRVDVTIAYIHSECPTLALRGGGGY